MKQNPLASKLTGWRPRFKFFGYHTDRPQSSPQVQCGPFAKGLELQITPIASNLALHSWIRCRSSQHRFCICLLSSTKLTSMAGTCRNSNIHWTSQIMMMMMMICYIDFFKFKI